jgi:hypothetical protein
MEQYEPTTDMAFQAPFFDTRTWSALNSILLLSNQASEGFLFHVGDRKCNHEEENRAPARALTNRDRDGFSFHSRKSLKGISSGR